MLTLANVMGVVRVPELEPVSIDVVAPNLDETHYTQDIQLFIPLVFIWFVKKALLGG